MGESNPLAFSMLHPELPSSGTFPKANFWSSIRFCGQNLLYGDTFVENIGIEPKLRVAQTITRALPVKLILREWGGFHSPAFNLKLNYEKTITRKCSD